jgi:hypothetical protein
VKNLLTGFICTCLLLITGLPGRAQEKKPDPQSPDQTPLLSNTAPTNTDVSQPAPTASTDASQQPAAPADSSSSDQQTPQQPPAAPQQNPPAGQSSPTGQTPVPPPAEDQPTPHSILAQPPPPPPKVPDVRRPGESGFWIGVEGWIPKQQPFINGGNQSDITGESTFIRFQGKPNFARGIEAGMAVGLHNTLKFSFTDFTASGDFTTPIEIAAWNQVYSGGTYVSTNYHVQNFKLSYEYLTWPFPVGGRKIRLKTLWQVQFTNISTAFDAPFNYYDSNGNLILDSNGQPIDLEGAGTKHIISPEFGLGFSYYPSRHVRIEMTGTGFGFPHRYYIWNGDFSVNYRVLSHFEIGAGARGLGFKTSTNSDFFIKGNWLAAFAGIRWYSNSE